jgi:signal transduction histidine kinase
MAFAAGVLWWQFNTPSELAGSSADAGVARSGPYYGLVVSAILAAVAGWFVVRLQTRAAHGREARAQLHALGEVLDVWQWRTDVSHRIAFARPPSGAAGPEWSAAAQRPASCLWELFRVADETALRAQMANAASLTDLEVWRHGTDGRLVRGRLRGRAIGDADGAFSGYIGTVRDLPEATAIDTASAAASTAAPALPLGLQAAPQPALAQAATADAEAERESFSYTVSHDLRAPIRVVEGFTKIVKEDYGSVLDRVGLDHLDRVLGAAARMNSMIDALLAISKLSTQPIARQPVNLTQLAGFIVEDLRRLWPDREVVFEVMDGMQVQGDPTLLRIGLENLLGNAWKYTGQCAQARVRFERTANEPATFTVSDNGAGFDMRFADRLFGVFQRLHSTSEFPGTGIGLASVRRIVRRHGGEIWAEAEIDRGARFHFTLPQERGAR